MRLHKSFVVELAYHLLFIVCCLDHLRKLLEVHLLISGLNLAQLPLEVYVELVVHSIAGLALAYLEVLSVRKDVVLFHYQVSRLLQLVVNHNDLAFHKLQAHVGQRTRVIL